MKKKLYALSGVLLIVLVVTGLWATKAVSPTGVEQTRDPAAALGAGMSMREMVEGSSLIVIGQCLETRSEWNNRRLNTLATVSVTETLKGDAPATLTVVLPGGIDANRRIPVAMRYAGAPTMAPEEGVVLFLTEDGEVANGYSVVGFSAGKFSVVQDADGEKAVASAPMRVRAPRVTGLTSGNPQVVRLSEFKEMVRSYLN
ncbi:MAG TPA: hypothetical protein VIM99_11430 [Blastocatellia bacterium]